MAKQWHVSTTGKTGNNGTAREPFGTLEQARNAIRIYRKQNPEIITEPQTVIIADGSYHLNETFILEALDSGTSKAPVVYKAANQGKVFISTASNLSADMFRRPADIEKSRLKESAHRDILVADISPELAAVFGSGQSDYGILAWNEHLLQLAQWPNRGYHHINKIYNVGPAWRWLKTGESPAPFSYEKPCGGKFSMVEKFNISKWQEELKRTKDIEQNGYLSVDWTNESNMVARISDDGIIQLLDSSRYGVGGVGDKASRPVPDFKVPKNPKKRNRRLVFRNILYELDMPGEWYFDRQENKLYLWPIDPDLSKAAITVPSGPLMLKLVKTSNVRFEGIVFENGGDKVLSVEKGDHIVFAGCTFRNLKGKVGVLSGSNSGFQSCDFYNMNTCLSVGAGDVENIENRNDYKVESDCVRTLTRLNNYIDNCIFHDIRDVEYGAISLIGCGISFTNNLVYHVNSGIWYSGMYIKFENNEFYEVGIGMGDWNIVYQGGNFWCNGNRVENNFFHHMFQTPSMHGVIAARNDDGGSGTTYNSNIFFKTGCGGVVSMGPDCHVTNNIVLDTTTIWRTNKRPITPEAIENEYRQIRDNFESGKYPRGAKEDRIYNVETAVGKEGWKKEPFKSAFPDFAKYMEENPFAQSYSSVMNNYSNLVDEDDPYNVIYIHGSFQLADDDGVLNQTDKMNIAFPKSFKHNAPKHIRLTDFIDYKSLDFTLKPNFKAIPGFVPCDFSKVGLYSDQYRKNPPDKQAYRKRIYEKHKFHLPDPKGLSYDQKTAYKMYPVHSWLEDEPVKWACYPYLSGVEDIGWVAKVPVRRDMDYHGKSIVIGGKNYKYGLMTYPHSTKKHAEITFDLTEYPQAKGFAATVGLDNAAGRKGSCIFIVKAEKDCNWTTLYKSPKRAGKDSGLDINVNLQGYNLIKLIATDAGDGNRNDHAVWANARFTE